MACLWLPCVAALCVLHVEAGVAELYQCATCTHTGLSTCTLIGKHLNFLFQEESGMEDSSCPSAIAWENLARQRPPATWPLLVIQTWMWLPLSCQVYSCTGSACGPGAVSLAASAETSAKSLVSACGCSSSSLTSGSTAGCSSIWTRSMAPWEAYEQQLAQRGEGV